MLNGLQSPSILLCVITFLALAGCGGGGGGASDTPMQPQDLPFDIASDTLDDLMQRQQGLAINPATNTTTLGSVTYSGVILFTSDQTGNNSQVARVVGDIDLSINLSRSENIVSGSITDLIEPSGDRLNGTLQVSNGSVDTAAVRGSDYSFSASLEGSLTHDDGQRYVGSGGLEGDFLGSGRDDASGTSYLQLTSGQGTARLVGTFAATD